MTRPQKALACVIVLLLCAVLLAQTYRLGERDGRLREGQDGGAARWTDRMNASDARRRAR